jgi:tripartite-type tricarboxylate transporter receptor subunit TctC
VGWFALFAPAGTPKAIVNKLYEESAKIVKLPDMRDKLANIDCIPVGSTPEQLREIMKTQVNQWIATAKLANIKPQ